MANTGKRGRPPKSTVTKVENNNIKTENQDDIIKKLMEQIEKQNAKMAEMQKQIESSNTTPTVVVANDNSSVIRGKKIKVINLMQNPLNISTEPNGGGRVYSFKNYGDSRLIKFDDLADIVAAYPNTMEHGMAYICDKEAVEELGLSDEYSKLFDKERMDRVVWLREESDLDLFLGMDRNLQESAAIRIAELINANERMDYNYLRTIKENTGIDIEEIAKELKDLQRKPSDE
jgi:hypothetical protein